MVQGGVLLGRDPAEPGGVLHLSPRTRITRVTLGGRTVLRKEPRGPDGPRRLRHEREMLERLRGIPGVVQLVTEPGDRAWISLEDVRGTPLASLPTPMAPDALVDLASGLARAVQGMHDRSVLHRDIAPANVVVSPAGAPWLIDFAVATTVAEIRPEFLPRSEIVGTLEFLAPEQTGRTGRPVDRRSDLYALGATLYELATGAPPFGSGDALRLTHDHLARVPEPPAEVNPAVPPVLSRIILHLLEKEPDDRYQTAAALVRDLELLRTGSASSRFRVGEQDFAFDLSPPSRLVGRATQLTALSEAFEDAIEGRLRGVLIGGPAGVGKTALVGELRPVVARRDGWFLSGKFDRYRRDLEFDAMHQAMRALGRLLLAEPEEELSAIRARTLEALAANAGLVAAAIPEFARLLDVSPDPGDPLTAQARGRRGVLAILRSVASRDRPIVLFADDLQWAGRNPVGLVDLLLREEPIAGLLLVGAYREGDGGRLTTETISRWREREALLQLRLENLPESDVLTLVADILRADRSTAASLAQPIDLHTRGNPFETVELLRVLRGEGLLAATPEGWDWDPAAVLARLRRSEADELLPARIVGIPRRTRAELEAMACLGGRVDTSVLAVATGESVGDVEQALLPALSRGVLVAETGAVAVFRFRHDRLRDMVLQGLGPGQERALHLALAGRLAEVPELFTVAAEQYLAVPGPLGEEERRRAVLSLVDSAGRAGVMGDHAHVDALLTRALQLIDPAERRTMAEILTRRHAALFSLGRLEEADEDYLGIVDVCPSALDRAVATAVQVRSLSHRTRFAEALALGLESLRECGIEVPATGRFAADFQLVHRWLEGTDGEDERARPELAEPRLLATATVIDAVLPVAYFVADPSMIAWLTLEALRLWLTHGPSPLLIGPAAHAVYHAGVQGGDHRAAYRALRRIVAVGDTRGYEPGTSQARYMSAALAGWFEPIENGVERARQSREGLISGADLAYAGYTYQLSVPYSMDCAPSLADLVAEIDGGAAFLRRTGNEQTGRWLDSYRWLSSALRRDGGSRGIEAVPLERYADDPLALAYGHLCHAIEAAIFGRSALLARHSVAATRLITAFAGFYSTAQVRLLRGLSAADEARSGDGDDRDDRLQELDEAIDWLGSRAVDVPDNFLHLQHLLEGERGWVAGDFRAAALAFDAALQQADGRRRPWHRALIAERAARFHLAHGAAHVGRVLLGEARDAYAVWGATAKVAELDWGYPAPIPVGGQGTAVDDGVADDAGRRSTVRTGAVDLLGILSASQALSSETSLERLHLKVTEVLRAMTGATDVHLLVWNDARQDWLSPVRDDEAGSEGSEAAPRRLDLPMSVVRYVQRVRQPLLVEDVGRDDRFARDPYFAEVGGAALLALPVLDRGSLRGLLLLQNRLIHGAFTNERLDAVELIAAQLTVSLDNAQLYAELKASRARIVAASDEARRRIERDLHDGAQQRLVALAVKARTAQSLIPAGADELATELDLMAREAIRASEELRELARGIHPAVLAGGGLGPALAAVARRCPIPVALHVGVHGRLPERIELAAYFAVAETLTNAVKHARATSVSVLVEVDGGVLRLRVSDDGRGGADLRRGSGLQGLKDRFEALGGRFSVQQQSGEGTTVGGELPLEL